LSPRLRAALAAVLVLAHGCAAVDREVVFRTNPSNVRVSEGGVAVRSVGPGRYKLDPSRDHDLRVEADGYEPTRLLVTSHVSGLRVTLVVVETLCLSIIVLPLLWPTWIATGYWYELEPEEPTVTLVKNSGSTGSAPVATRPTPPASPPRPTPSAPAPAPPPPPPQPPPATSAFCGSCGARLVQSAAFCGSCGARVP
jgi:hypothetical protein